MVRKSNTVAGGLAEVFEWQMEGGHGFNYPGNWREVVDRARDAGSWPHIASPGWRYLPQPGEQFLGPSFRRLRNNAGRDLDNLHGLLPFPDAGAAIGVTEGSLACDGSVSRAISAGRAFGFERATFSSQPSL